MQPGQLGAGSVAKRELVQALANNSPQMELGGYSWVSVSQDSGVLPERLWLVCDNFHIAKEEWQHCGAQRCRLGHSQLCATILLPRCPSCRVRSAS